ncbi:replication initiation negative regulator SeqA [Pseudocolwellia agarivorans]|uniref:replication initiation negative regulator SeqA n=1 Tax=Pseudocolwellia agarivorans TaxID=1911682 RepID=UPI0009872A9C|nr:replication initiation negative regulator SeqA [Pseudocolwellia agarivorans]
MKNIEIEEDLYQYIASQTQFIGESASSILRRLLFENEQHTNSITTDKIADSIEPIKIIEEPEFENVVEQTTVDNQSVTQEIETNESVFNYLNKEELAMQRGAVGRFLLILGALYRVHANNFSVVSDIRGRDRLYFSANLNELTESGSSTKPFQIPESPYWVVTNSNTTRKKMILTKVALALGYSESEAEDIRELL